VADEIVENMWIELYADVAAVAAAVAVVAAVAM
jgi:hypothetical protein